MQQSATSGAQGANSDTSGLVRFGAAFVVLAGVLAAGLVGGWVAASQKTSSAARHGEGGGHGGEAHDDHAASAGLSERTLANLGVEIGKVTTSDFVPTLDVPALVEALPQSDRRLASPVAGTLLTLHVRPGDIVRAGDPVADVLRDAFPQPVLALTEGIITPLNENHHEAAVNLRSSALNLEIAKAERERLASSASAGAERVVGRVLRDAEYADRRAALELESARHEAGRHGMTDEQIALLERGGGGDHLPDVPDVQRVLARNRLWSPQADRLLPMLPEALRVVPFTLAVVGELVGTGRLTADLVDALGANAVLAERFIDVAGLVQAGATPAALVHLASQGGLSAMVTLRAPADGPPDWDVLELPQTAGTRVDVGAMLARLGDARRMALRLSPAPTDLPHLTRALTEGTALEMAPLVREASGRVTGVRLLALTGGSGEEPAGALALVNNTPLAEVEGLARGRARTWALRPGLAYVVEVPLERRPQRFVLPADAIAYRGAEAVVLLRHGSNFDPVPVRLEYHDARVAVVAADGALFVGDEIVLRGAPALALGLLAAAGGADPHAGHNH